MAGRKQHFIQRFLLKGFAFNAPNGTNRVWVYPKDGKIFPSALEGYGAERDFYGKPGESELDDGISEQEIKRFNKFLEESRTTSDQDLRADEAAEFAIHVFFRSKNIRSTLTTGLEQLMSHTRTQLRDPNILEQLLASGFRQKPEFLFSTFERLGLGQNGMSRESAERQSILLARIFLDAKGAQFEKLLNDFEQRVSDFVAIAHQKSLSERLNNFSGTRVQLLKSMRWIVLQTERHLVLGDSVAIAEIADGRFKPISEPTDDLVRVWLPVATNRVLVGTLNGESILDVDKLNRGSVSCSYHSFCAFEGPNEHQTLVPLIRTATFSLDHDAVERIVDECLAKAIE